jgi:hypothetical protein
MADNKPHNKRNSGKTGGTGQQPTRRGTRPVGVWNRSSSGGPANPIRVRTKRLDEIDGDKIALAYWLLAKQVVVDRSDNRPLSEAEVRRVAKRLDDHDSAVSPPSSSTDQTTLEARS